MTTYYYRAYFLAFGYVFRGRLSPVPDLYNANLGKCISLRQELEVPSHLVLVMLGGREYVPTISFGPRPHRPYPPGPQDCSLPEGLSDPGVAGLKERPSMRGGFGRSGGSSRSVVLG